MAHEGKATYRLKENVLEQRYHDEWKKEQQYGNILEWLLGDGTRKAVISDRDEMVAATVIQWLGSPVGQNFVKRVLGLAE